MSDLFWLTDEQIERLRPFLPKSHGRARADNRQVLSGIVFVNRNGLRWRDAPSAYGPHKTLGNRWKRWGERVYRHREQCVGVGQSLVYCHVIYSSVRSRDGIRGHLRPRDPQ